MRVLVAPDKFAGTLTAVQAAEAIAEGWRRQAPADELDLAPMADGGPGFVDVLHAALGGDLVATTVPGPLGEDVPATTLFVGGTAYVESAQACGVHLTGGRRGEEATSRGVGVLIARAAEAGARRVVVGLGGSGSNDGGAGVLAALGATADRPLDRGAQALPGITRVTLPQVDVALVAASDVDNPLTGMFGATKTFGPQKGVAEDRIAVVDGWLEELATATDRRTSLEKGAGAAGGIGYALLCLGATREPGIGLVADAVGLAERAPRRRPRGHRGGRLRLLQPQRQGPVRRRGDRCRCPAPVRGARRTGAGRVPRDARPGRGVGVLAGRPGR